MKFKVGDRVRMVRPVSDNITDIPATVFRVRGVFIHIEFDVRPGFGWCPSSSGRDGKCWSVTEEDIEFVSFQLELFGEAPNE